MERSLSTGADAREWIDALGLERHPEGGWFIETYRCVRSCPTPGGERPLATSILYLLEAGDFSALHQLRAQELWFFHAGDPLLVHVLPTDPTGDVETVTLGATPAAGARPQTVVPPDRWFGAEPAPGSRWSLVGCAVVPGFDFADFELARRDDLLERYPRHAELVRRLTREERAT